MKTILFSFIIVASCLASAQDQSFDLKKYQGKVVYLDFWASWCGPCKESFPWLNKLVEQYPKLVVIGINLDKEKQEADQFLKKYPAKFPVIFNPEGNLAEKYGVKGMPYSIIIDKKGEKAFSHIGFSKEKAKEYEKQIQSLLESQ